MTMSVSAPAKVLAENTVKENAEETALSAEETFNQSVRLLDSHSTIFAF